MTSSKNTWLVPSLHGSKRFGQDSPTRSSSTLPLVLAGHAYEYLKRLRREERERYQYQQALVASELHSLKAQLRPHFLFNTRHRIATLVDGDSKNAHAMIIKLSDLLRTALDSDSADLTNLFAGRAEICQGIPGSGKDALRQAPPDRMAGCSRDQMGCWYRR